MVATSHLHDRERSRVDKLQQSQGRTIAARFFRCAFRFAHFWRVDICQPDFGAVIPDRIAIHDAIVSRLVAAKMKGDSRSWRALRTRFRGEISDRPCHCDDCRNGHPRGSRRRISLSPRCGRLFGLLFRPKGRTLPILPFSRDAPKRQVNCQDRKPGRQPLVKDAAHIGSSLST